MSCPYCKTPTGTPNKEWKYRGFIVKSFKCTHCGLNFNVYYHDGKLSHTIPKSPTTQAKIQKYLTVYGQASKEEIAKKLKITPQEVDEATIK